MITYKHGDILTEDTEAIVNTVNCVGVMGRGIALQFKNKYPDNFKFYANACKRNQVTPGQMLVYDTGFIINPRYIINFPTKRHWKGKSRLEDIQSGLDALKAIILQYEIRSIAIPPLGSGLGGLEWETVRHLIEETLQSLNAVQVTIFTPQGAPQSDKMAHPQKPPDMTPGRAVLITLMHRYLDGLLDPFITLLELHKLMYFLQESGEPLRLKYKKAAYGPYADNLRHVLNAIEGYFIDGYADGGDSPHKQLQLVPGAIEDATSFLQNHKQSMEHYDRVADLVDGYETPFGLELLSTVHWVIKNEDVKNMDDVVDQTHRWNEHKKQFSKRQIVRTAEVLQNKGWIEQLE